MDIETALKRYLVEREDAPEIRIYLNEEARIVLVLHHDGGTMDEFVAVGDKLLPYPVKPPAIRVGVPGFEDFNRGR